MRVIAAALALFVCTTAGAQTVDPSELIYGPFEPGPRDRAAVAVAAHGMLVAWSEIDPGSRVATIHTALHDFDARRIGPVHSLPSTRANVHAYTPAIATDGSRFFVAWLERDRHATTPRDVAGALVDGSGMPLRGSEGFGAAVAGARSLIWNGLDYRLFGTGNHAVSTAGDMRIVSFGVTPQRVAFANPDANGWIDWSNERVRPLQPPCISFCGGGFPPRPEYVLDYAILTGEWIRSGRLRYTGSFGSAPVVAMNGNDVLMLWTNPQGLQAQRIDDGEAGTTFNLMDKRIADAVLSMAGLLIVFEYQYDIYGVLLNGGAFGPIFPISNGADDFDTLPLVTAAGPERYLVTFLREAESRNVELVHRFIDTTP
jgi:hypothetical protein